MHSNQLKKKLDPAPTNANVWNKIFMEFIFSIITFISALPVNLHFSSFVRRFRCWQQTIKCSTTLNEPCFQVESPICLSVNAVIAKYLSIVWQTTNFNRNFILPCIICESAMHYISSADSVCHSFCSLSIFLRLFSHDYYFGSKFPNSFNEMLHSIDIPLAPFSLSHTHLPHSSLSFITFLSRHFLHTVYIVFLSLCVTFAAYTLFHRPFSLSHFRLVTTFMASNIYISLPA